MASAGLSVPTSNGDWPHSVDPCDHKLVLLVLQILEFGQIKQRRDGPLQGRLTKGEDRYLSDEANNHRHTQFGKLLNSVPVIQGLT